MSLRREQLGHRGVEGPVKVSAIYGSEEKLRGGDASADSCPNNVDWAHRRGTSFPEVAEARHTEDATTGHVLTERKLNHEERFAANGGDPDQSFVWLGGGALSSSLSSR